MGRDGALDGEPEFPRALAEYREALRRAKAQAEPPFDPPPDFMPNLRNQPELRRINWRSPYRFPESGRSPGVAF